MDDMTTEADQFWTGVLERTAGNPRLAATLARKLFEELPQLLEEAEESLGKQDLAAARRAVHKLAGDAAIFHIKSMYEAAYAMETLLAQGRAASCAALRDTVTTVLRMREYVLKRAGEA
jgi:HPt (histidine-containing phosphotransfer) domain-containing protein